MPCGCKKSNNASKQVTRVKSVVKKTAVSSPTKTIRPTSVKIKKVIYKRPI